jgi:hypothetical protein
MVQPLYAEAGCFVQLVGSRAGRQYPWGGQTAHHWQLIITGNRAPLGVPTGFTHQATTIGWRGCWGVVWAAVGSLVPESDREHSGCLADAITDIAGAMSAQGHAIVPVERPRSVARLVNCRLARCN